MKAEPLFVEVLYTPKITLFRVTHRFRGIVRVSRFKNCSGCSHSKEACVYVASPFMCRFRF